MCRGQGAIIAAIVRDARGVVMLRRLRDVFGGATDTLFWSEGIAKGKALSEAAAACSWRARHRRQRPTEGAWRGRGRDPPPRRLKSGTATQGPLARFGTRF